MSSFKSRNICFTRSNAWSKLLDRANTKRAIRPQSSIRSLSNDSQITRPAQDSTASLTQPLDIRYKNPTSTQLRSREFRIQYVGLDPKRSQREARAHRIACTIAHSIYCKHGFDDTHKWNEQDAASREKALRDLQTEYATHEALREFPKLTSPPYLQHRFLMTHTIMKSAAKGRKSKPIVPSADRLQGSNRNSEEKKEP